MGQHFFENFTPSVEHKIYQALESVSTTGGKSYDADILGRIIGKPAAPYLGAIRTGSSNCKAADELKNLYRAMRMH